MNKQLQDNLPLTSQKIESQIDQAQVLRLRQIQKEQYERQQFAKQIFLPMNQALITQSFLAPLELIKTRFQLMGQMIRNKTLQNNYTSYVNCLKTTFKEQKRGLYKGNLAYSLFLMGQIPLTAITIQKVKIEMGTLLKKNYMDQHQIFKYGNPIPYLFYGVGGLIMHPFEYVRIRLMTDKQSLIRDGKKQFSGIINTIKQSLDGDGLRGIYRGIWTSYFNRTIHRSLFFGLNQAILSHLKQVDTKTKLLISSVSFFAADVLTYPIDTIRKRMMMRTLQNQKYNSSFSCMRYIIKNENLLKGLYGGIGITIFRSVVGGVFLLGADENAKQILSKQSQNQLFQLPHLVHLINKTEEVSNKKIDQPQV